MKWKPTRKWIAARVAAVTTLIISIILTGGFEQEQLIVLVTIVSEAIVAWLVPNKQTESMDGVPE